MNRSGWADEDRTQAHENIKTDKKRKNKNLLLIKPNPNEMEEMKYIWFRCWSRASATVAAERLATSNVLSQQMISNWKIWFITHGYQSFISEF